MSSAADQAIVTLDQFSVISWPGLRLIQRRLQFLDSRLAPVQIAWHRFQERVGRYANRLGHVAQGILRHHLALALAQDETNARLDIGVAQQVVDGREEKFILPANSGSKSTILMMWPQRRTFGSSLLPKVRRWVRHGEHVHVAQIAW